MEKLEDKYVNKCLQYIRLKKKTISSLVDYDISDEEGSKKLYKKLLKADPTSNKKWCIWIIDQFSKNQFSLDDIDDVKNVLIKFLDITKKGYLKAKDVKQINELNFKEMSDYVNSVIKFEPIETDDEIILYDGLYGTLIIPKNQKTSCEFGRGTKWCTAATISKNYFNKYISRGIIYIWLDKRLKKKFQFFFPRINSFEYIWEESFEFKDEQNNNLDEKLLNYFVYEHPYLKNFFKEQELVILNSIKENKIKKSTIIHAILQWCLQVIKDRWKEIENYILTSNYELGIREYAYNVVKDRWVEFEDYVLNTQDPLYKFPIIWYCKNIIKGRWYELENKILKDADLALEYMIDIIKSRWSELEKNERNMEYILKNDDTRTKYEEFIKNNEYSRGRLKSQNKILNL
jgi:hypothetical protein